MANMFLLNIDHPEIEDFINKKTDFDKGYQTLKYANISIGINDKFVKAVLEDEDYELVDPHDKSIRFTKKARDLWLNTIVNTTLHAEPGIINFDSINKDNPIAFKSEITSVNPCVVGDTKVLTDRGLINAKDLTTDMKVWSPISKQFLPIKKFYNNGVQDIKEIVLKNGIKIRVTNEHKLYTKDKEWVMAQDLKIGDEIQYVLDNVAKNIVGNDEWLKEIKPELSVTEKAWLLGLILGDGSITLKKNKTHSNVFIRTTLTINAEDVDLYNAITELLEKSNTSYKVYDKDYNAVQIRINDNEFNKWISQVFKLYEKIDGIDEVEYISTKDNKMLPEQLFTSSEEVISAFISGYFDSDGTISFTKKGNHISISSTYEDIISKLQPLFAMYGIYTNNVKTSRKGKGYYDKRNGKTYTQKDYYRLVISTLYRDGLKEIFRHLRSNKKKLFDILFETPLYRNAKHFLEKNQWLEIVEITNVEREEVFDIEAGPDFVWVTNGVLSYDCAEYNGYDQSVCVLGSLNLYSFVDKNNNFMFGNLYSMTKLLHTFLTLSNFSNEFPLPELTYNTRRYRNTGLGYMGLSSVLLKLGLRYGSKESYDLFKDIMKHISNAVVVNSTDIAKIIGSFEGFEEALDRARTLIRLGDIESITKDTNFVAEENKEGNYKLYYLVNTDNPDTKIEIALIDRNGEIIEQYNGIANARLLSIAPTGSISYITQVSSGIEPIFLLAYRRRINPDMPSEYTVEVYDVALEDYLIENYGEEKAKEIITKIINGEKPEEVYKDFIVTTSDLDMIDRLAMLFLSNIYIDMNTSVTFNIQRDTDVDSIDFDKFKIYGSEYMNKILEDFEKYRMDKEIVEQYLEKYCKDEHNFKAVANFVSKYAPYSEQEEFLEKHDTFDKLVKTKEYSKFVNTVNVVNNFYILSQLFKIKGVTVYVEGSRTPILSRVEKKKEEKKTDKPKLQLNINIDKKTKKILPKERPAIIQTMKKTITFKINDEEKRMFVELGLVEGEPFEVFFRATQTTKEYAELFETAGRLISVSIRSGVKIEETIKQLRKVKNWKNEYSPVTQIMYEALNELLNIATSKGKKRKELIQKEEETKNWILDAKGYYIDEEGNKRCPVCKSKLRAQSSCVDCPDCGWTACA
jgi:ribonucleoside-diphosphate reductase alpha chain